MIPHIDVGPLLPGWHGAWGFADLHAHPASHLAFGANEHGEGGVFWGKPGLRWEDADRTIATDLSPCIPDMHYCGGLPGCGDEDAVRHTTRQRVLGQINNITGLPHRSGGWPNFDGWPHARNLLHQQMHITSLRRAWQGGLRLIIASVTDNQSLTMLWRRAFNAPPPEPDPNLDFESAKRQLAFIRQLVEANSSWMAIVESPAQARIAISHNKLAVILSLEMDTLSINQILTLKTDYGVRHITPIHLVNNVFGGVAVYADLFNSHNWYVNGYFLHVTGDPILEFRLGRPQKLLPTSFGAVEPISIDDSDYRALGYPADQGHRNTLGLSEGYLSVLMNSGLLIDIAHMSDASQAAALDLAERYNYPLMNSHTGLRPDDAVSASERSMRRSLAARMARLGGVLGLGTEGKLNGDPVENWVNEYCDALEVMGNRGVALGTDMNGYAAQIPHSVVPVSYPITVARDIWRTDYSLIAGAPGASEPPLLERHALGARAPFDFHQDGLAHFGLLPDFLQAVHTQLGASGRDANQLVGQMFHTAEDTIAMWEKVERSAHVARIRMTDGEGGPTVCLYSWYSAANSDNFTTSDPEWAGRPGDETEVNSGYRCFRIGGAAFSPHHAQPAGTIPMNAFWSNDLKDHALTTTRVFEDNVLQLTGGGFRHRNVGVAGYIFPANQPQPAGTIPLYRWHSNTTKDHITTADPAWAGSPGMTRAIAGNVFKFSCLEGYVIAPLTGLYSWWHEQGADNFATTQEDWTGFPGYERNGYKFYRVEGRISVPICRNRPGPSRSGCGGMPVGMIIS